MPYDLRPIDDRFFEDAPLVVPATVELEAAPERVWEALGSDRMWSWVPALDRLRWVTPHGPGAIRLLRIAQLVTVEEEFYRWEPARRATFRVTRQSRRVLNALAEDFLLEPTATGTRLTWTMALEPRPAPPRAVAAVLTPALAKGNALGLAGITTIL
ncbi:MAG TPA: SRPBCC family protein [Baekduia sp.]|nr:SRPBCC family protein [Baekduia sp.]